MSKRPLGYLGGDIMSFGSNLAREYEYQKFNELKLPVDVYSPVQNKAINDKNAVTEEENNRLAEKITQADIERLWNSDFVVMSPEQSAIGSMCETGCLFGWKYMADKLIADVEKMEAADGLSYLMGELRRIAGKKNFFHYFDIRNTQLNEKGWRRSFSINQLLYGMVLYTAEHGDFESFDAIMAHLQELYAEKPDDQAEPGAVQYSETKYIKDQLTAQLQAKEHSGNLRDKAFASAIRTALDIVDNAPTAQVSVGDNDAPLFTFTEHVKET